MKTELKITELDNRYGIATNICHIKEIKTKFSRSYNCITQNSTQVETINKHAKILVECFNEARILIPNHREKLNQTHWSAVSRLLVKLRSNLVLVQRRYNLDISIPTILNTPLTVTTSEESKNDQVDIDSDESESDHSSDTEIKEKDLQDLTIPAVLNLRNKSTTEQELAAIHWAIKHFRPYI